MRFIIKGLAEGLQNRVKFPMPGNGIADYRFLNRSVGRSIPHLPRVGFAPAFPARVLFGRSSNPKIGLDFHPVPAIEFRVSLV